jgi:hypothetical protein
MKKNSIGDQPLKQRKGGKRLIIRNVIVDGRLSARKAKRSSDAVFDCMEIPSGAIQVNIRKGKPWRERHRFRNLQTRKTMSRTVRYPDRRARQYGWRRETQATPETPKPIEASPPVLPPPETPAMSEVCQLATELLVLERPVNQDVITVLQQAVEVNPHIPGALLRRLRDFRSRVWQFQNVYSLAAQLTAHYWL